MHFYGSEVDQRQFNFFLTMPFWKPTLKNEKEERRKSGKKVVTATAR